MIPGMEANSKGKHGGNGQIQALNSMAKNNGLQWRALLKIGGNGSAAANQLVNS